MITIDPQQELFTALKLSLEAKGYDVYDDGLPSKDAPYPFIHLGNSQQIDDANKSAVFGYVHQTINAWHTSKNRGTLSEMLLTIKAVCRKLQRTANFSWTVRNISQDILPDNTTNTPLLHGVLNIEFYFS